MLTTSRRGFIAALAASPFLANQARALPTLEPIADEPPVFDESQLERIFVDNSEPIGEEYVVKGLGDWPLWWNQLPLEMAQWPVDADSIDYAHLAGRADEESFQLTDIALRRIVSSHGYAESLLNNNSLVLLGIRGATRVDGLTRSPDFERHIELVESKPDHFDYQCQLGVWNTANGKVWLTRASTIPHVAYLFAQREASTFSNEANMMPTGHYLYMVGTHRNSTTSAQPGAFRPANRAFSVLRCVESGPIVLNRNQYWDTRTMNHGDNIHAGTYSTREDRPRYWSAGCQVVPGYYTPDDLLPQGDWAHFRIAAGLNRTPVITQREQIAPNRFDIKTSEDGRRFSYILTTGRDVLLASTDDAVASMRFGSSGPKVKALQAALDMPVNQRDGVFGIAVQRRVLGIDESNIPIVDNLLANILGITV